MQRSRNQGAPREALTQDERFQRLVDRAVARGGVDELQLMIDVMEVLNEGMSAPMLPSAILSHVAGAHPWLVDRIAANLGPFMAGYTGTAVAA